MPDNTIPEQLTIIINKYPQLSEIIRFGYEISMELKKMQPDLDLSSLKLTPELANLKLKDGFPFLNKSEITIPAAQFNDVFKRISSIIAEMREPLQSTILELVRKVENQELDIQQLAQSTLKTEPHTIEETEDKGKNGSLINFLIRTSLKPFGHAYGIALKSYLPSKETLWLQSYCPICGSYPLLAYIEGEEGRRHLICSWCDTSWIYPRIKCPYCQNIDQKDLNYFSLDDEKEEKEKDRVSVCRKCRKYIKTLDARRWDRENIIDFHIDDLATIHLDLLAEREGYERMTRHFLSF